MSTEVSRRVDGGRCVVCNHVTVDAWVCIDCGFGYSHRAISDQRQAPTPTYISRLLRRRVDRASDAADLVEIQGLPRSRQYRTVKDVRLSAMITESNSPSFTPEEMMRIRAMYSDRPYAFNYKPRAAVRAARRKARKCQP